MNEGQALGRIEDAEAQLSFAYNNLTAALDMMTGVIDHLGASEQERRELTKARHGMQQMVSMLEANHRRLGRFLDGGGF